MDKWRKGKSTLLKLWAEQKEGMRAGNDMLSGGFLILKIVTTIEGSEGNQWC